MGHEWRKFARFFMYGFVFVLMSVLLARNSNIGRCQSLCAAENPFSTMFGIDRAWFMLVFSMFLMSWLASGRERIEKAAILIVLAYGSYLTAMTIIHGYPICVYCESSKAILLAALLI